MYSYVSLSFLIHHFYKFILLFFLPYLKIHLLLILFSSFGLDYFIYLFVLP
jgi:hypothetical protein